MLALQRPSGLPQEGLEATDGGRHSLPARILIRGPEVGLRESPTGRALAQAGSLCGGRDGRSAQEGGEVIASDMIYTAVRRARETIQGRAKRRSRS